MDPLEAPDGDSTTNQGEILSSIATAAVDGVLNSPGQVLMSEFDKKSLRLIGILLVSSFIILLILYCWAREFCRRNLGFGSRVFKARKKNKQKWKKLN